MARPRERLRFDKLVAEMRQPDPERAEDAFGRLEAVAPDFVDELLVAFETERERDEGLAGWLLELLGASKSPKAVELFTSLLGDSNEEYVSWAKRGLNEINTKEARSALYRHEQCR